VEQRQGLFIEIDTETVRQAHGYENHRLHERYGGIETKTVL